MLLLYNIVQNYLYERFSELSTSFFICTPTNTFYLYFLIAWTLYLFCTFAWLNFFSHFGLHDCLSAPRPECVSDPECPNHLACIQEKCQNPCFTHSCGQNAECKVKNHRALCVCLYGYVGDPYSLCEERKINMRPYELTKKISNFF